MNSQKNNPVYRILIIDDNVSIHQDFSKILLSPPKTENTLRRMESDLFGTVPQVVSSTVFEIDCASQGKEGHAMVKRAKAQGRPYALAFVDGRMPPGWDGVETIGRLWEVCPDLQVVLCTAYADYSWQEIRRVVGETDSLLILKKPFDNVEVLQLAHALTRKWELNREVQGRLNQLAFYDNLTGLPNRTLFLDRLNQTIDKASRYNHKVGLLYIDLDNFKRINDTLGHSIGDDLLKQVSRRLVKCFRTSDTVSRTSPDDMAARLGGDEFTVILPELDRVESAGRVAQRLSEQLTLPIELDDHEVIVTPSIGISIFPDDGDTVETLLKNADIAMYYSKRMAPNSFKYFQEFMNASALKWLTIENHLRQALDRDEFSLQYQPQVDLATGNINGMEALIRWQNKELGNIPPLDFITIAEETGSIVAIGEWVLRTACLQAREWINQGLPLKRMAVNISLKQFTHPDFLEMVRNVLGETDLAPQYLELEITESLLEKDTKRIISILETLKEMDVQISIDDFGTGYSSLNRLKSLPFDCLKIDKCFISGIGSCKKDRSIISAIVAMAKGMNLRLIAEGVETEEQARFLREKKCRGGQGYLFCMPLAAPQVEAFWLNSLNA